MKKVITLMVVLVLVLALSSTAFALSPNASNGFENNPVFTAHNTHDHHFTHDNGTPRFWFESTGDWDDGGHIVIGPSVAGTNSADSSVISFYNTARFGDNSRIILP